VLQVPASSTAGSPFSVTLIAKDADGNIDTNYTGTVQFRSDDSHASLPGTYTFTAGSGGDNGQHTFTDAVTLKTAGSRTVTVTAASLSAGGAVALNPAAATHFDVAAVPSSTAGSAFSVTVTALD